MPTSTTILRQSVICEGIEYLLVYRSTGTGSQGWAWLDAVNRNPVPLADVDKLRDAFLTRDDLARVGRARPPRELRRLYEVLLSMGLLAMRS